MRVELPIPANWQDFEDFCRDLFAAEWNDPHTQKHGRPGQADHGVDVYGQREGRWQGVQCKLRRRFPESKLTEKEIEHEVRAARDFHSPLESLVIATTAPTDTSNQAVAARLTGEVGFRVVIYSWSDLCERLPRHPKLFNEWQRKLGAPQKPGADITVKKTEESQLKEIPEKLTSKNSMTTTIQRGKKPLKGMTPNLALVLSRMGSTSSLMIAIGLMILVLVGIVTMEPRMKGIGSYPENQEQENLAQLDKKSRVDVEATLEPILNRDPNEALSTDISPSATSFKEEKSFIKDAKQEEGLCQSYSAPEFLLKRCRSPFKTGSLSPVPGMKFNYIRPCQFCMGSPTTERNRDDDEHQHLVSITRGFWMAESETTQEQWMSIARHNPSSHKDCGSCPVERVNWYEAVWFANQLSEQSMLESCYTLLDCTERDPGKGFVCEEVIFTKGLGCKGYRLPTEAEWELAARSAWPNEILFEVPWCNDRDIKETQEFEEMKKASDKRLHYNMVGNVWEWTWDFYRPYPLDTDKIVDPTGPLDGSTRVRRGGSWRGGPKSCRIADRHEKGLPGFRDSETGFRLAKTYFPEDPVEERGNTRLGKNRDP